jgi:branched-chain amino acid transport system substrate-binding protein
VGLARKGRTLAPLGPAQGLDRDPAIGWGYHEATLRAPLGPDLAMPRPRRPAWLALALLLAACQKEPIRLGGAFNLSGRHYDLGVSGRNGATIAVEELNAAGGIGGRRLELVVKDDEQDPEAARRAVRALVDQGVVAIVGHMTSAMTEATLAQANQARVLMVSPTTSAARYQGRDDWLVLLNLSTRASTAAVVERMTRVEHVRRLAVLQDLSNEVFTQAWVDGVTAELAARGGQVVVITFTSGEARPLGEAAALALAAKPDGILLLSNSLDSAGLAQQVRKLDPRIPLFGSDWGFTQDVVAHGGRAVEGVVFTQKVNVEDQSPRFSRFRDAYLARFSRPPDFAAALAYEAVQLLAEGLRRDATREGLRAALLSLGTFDGLQGPLELDGFGDVQRRQFVMTIRDGRIVPAE